MHVYVGNCLFFLKHLCPVEEKKKVENQDE